MIFKVATGERFLQIILRSAKISTSNQRMERARGLIFSYVVPYHSALLPHFCVPLQQTNLNSIYVNYPEVINP